jgi:dihydroxyacetone kinase-like protein
VNGDQLRTLLVTALPLLAEAKDELRSLDAAIGDGDLGITVSKGAEAVVTELAAGSGPVMPADVLKATAKRFASANPSTMSALVAAGLLAAIKQLGEVEDIDRPGAVALLTAVTERIAERGGAQPGDKTVIDALLPSIEVLVRGAKTPAPQLLSAMATTVSDEVARLAGAQSRRGRAAWVGERSMGEPDGGMVAYQRLLEALAASWPGTH